MSNKAVITGVGLVTPLGTGVEQTWAALLAGRSINTHAKVPMDASPGFSRVSSLAMRAAKEAVADNDLSGTALVVGTSKGPIESWLEAPSTLSDVEGPRAFGLASVACDLAREFSITGPKLTLSAACASGLHALIRGAMMIESGEATRVLVVAAEASVHPLFIANFARLGVLPAEGVGCRPFDLNRDGFLMSEAAAAVVLESSTAVRAGDGISVEKYALVADATHLTGVDPEGRALRHALARSTGDRSFDLLHAHGTGTAANDAVELSALDETVLETAVRPIVYSHKAALGHSLGAAGLVSVVLNVVSHRAGIIPANVRTREPLPSHKLSIPSTTTRRRVRRSLVVAAGFGGAIGVVELVG